jgi:DNA-binding CsgD family transcriptional regulator
MDTIRLTSRETDVLQLLARGCTYSQVGDRLGLSLHTVTSHIKNVYRKLEVHSARAAVWRAAELRLSVETNPMSPAIESTGRTA